MSRIFADREDPSLPSTEFSGEFNKAGWTPDGTMASSAYADFEVLQTHMNEQFKPFVDKEDAESWERNNPSSLYPLQLFVQSGWVLEWSDPDFRPVDEFDEGDAKSSAAELAKLL
jgi:hypothetical protein